MSEKVQNQATAAQGFWDVFKACLEENWIRPDRSPFYVKWAQTSAPERNSRAMEREVVASTQNQALNALVFSKCDDTRNSLVPSSEKEIAWAAFSRGDGVEYGNGFHPI